MSNQTFALLIVGSLWVVFLCVIALLPRRERKDDESLYANEWDETLSEANVPPNNKSITCPSCVTRFDCNSFGYVNPRGCPYKIEVLRGQSSQ